MTDMNARLVPVIFAALVSLSACGSSDSDTAPATAAAGETDVSTGEAAAGENTITISQSRFDRVELRVAAGTTVTFVNTDAFAHTITSRDGTPIAFDSGNLDQGETFEVTFDEPGEYPYFCQIHPTMRAVVIVE